MSLAKVLHLNGQEKQQIAKNSAKKNGSKILNKDKNDVVLVNKQVVLGGAQFWPKPKFSGIRWFLKRLHKEAAVEVSNYCLVHTVIKLKFTETVVMLKHLLCSLCLYKCWEARMS